jgi:hypothetical protein
MANPQNLKPFKKGDPRINRKGRPKSFGALRELAISISNEMVKKDNKPVIIDDHIATVAEMMLRTWATSRNPQLQRAFFEYAFGKVPDKTELSGPDGGPIATRDDYTDAERAARIAAILETAKKRNESSGS